MRKLLLSLAVACWGALGAESVNAQQIAAPVQPEIVLVDHHSGDAKPAPAASSVACPSTCACRPTLCLPRFSLHSLFCRCHDHCPPCPQPCPKPCPAPVVCPKPCPAPCPAHPIRPLFCREPAPCPKPVVHCEAKHAPCPQPCPSPCRPSLLERLHSLLNRDCSQPCHIITAPATPQPVPEKAPLPKPVN